MTQYKIIRHELTKNPKKWLVTGVAGFIGSNLLEALLRLNQSVIGLDNLSTGNQTNLNDVRGRVTEDQWSGFTFLEGDIRDLQTCSRACENTDYILHHAALCSVEQSIHDPVLTSGNNINGFLNILVSARGAGVKRIVFASSSAIYGNCEKLPLIEDIKGDLLSPYAADKRINELHAELFSRIHQIDIIGLRYFNIFGPRQNIDTTYGSVIPRWFHGLIRNEEVFINGDGKTSRDFCYIENCVQANILAAGTQDPEAVNKIYNIGFGKSIDLNNLYEMIRKRLSLTMEGNWDIEPTYQDFRLGDVRHSMADISKAHEILKYEPEYSIQKGLEKTAKWYLEKLR